MPKKESRRKNFRKKIAQLGPRAAKIFGLPIFAVAIPVPVPLTPHLLDGLLALVLVAAMYGTYCFTKTFYDKPASEK